MRLQKSARKLCWVYLLMCIGLAVLAGLLSLASNGDWEITKDSFAELFFFGGVGWLVIAYFSGGFVATYRAPITNPWMYAVPDRDSLVLPNDSPEVMEDLKEKMSNQIGGMVLAAVSGVGFFGLSILFYYLPFAGFASLIGIVMTLGILLSLGNERR